MVRQGHRHPWVLTGPSSEPALQLYRLAAVRGGDGGWILGDCIEDDKDKLRAHAKERGNRIV